MLLTIVAAAVLIVLSVHFRKSRTPPKARASRGRKKSPAEPGPWSAGNNERHGAR